MRTVSFQSVYESVLRRHGLDPLGDAITHDTARAITENINERTATAWTMWDWPELSRTEERAYRQVWNSSVQYRVIGEDGRPDELYYLPTAKYYQVKVDAPSDPPPATAPTNTTYFKLLDPITTFVARDQRNKRSMGPVIGVYSSNPGVNGCCSESCLSFRPSEKGITVCYGGPTVFVQYWLEPSEFTMVPYISGKPYVRGNRVFYTVDGNCYRCLADTDNDPPTDTDFWVVEPMPAIFAAYVKWGAYADCLKEMSAGTADAQARAIAVASATADAERAIQAEIDILLAQGQKHSYIKHGRYCRSWRYDGTLWWSQSGVCCSQPWTGSIAYALTDAVDRGGIVPLEPPDTLISMIYLPEIVSILSPEPSLRGYPSAPLPLGTLIVIAIIVSGSPQQQTWRVDPGPADPADPGHVEPADYNATTNNKHYRKVI
jgi:hypothetical protein